MHPVASRRWISLALGLAVLAPASVRADAWVTMWGSGGDAPGYFDLTVGVATDPAGNVYVVDLDTDRIQKFTNDGVFITEWHLGSTGASPHAVAVDDGYVYVADGNGDRVVKYTTSGDFVTQWGVHGSGDGEFNVPVGITVGPDHSVYVADEGNHRIEKFTSAGAYLTQWGSQGGGNGQFDLPRGLVTDATGHVFVTDQNIARVQEFSSTGDYVTQWGYGQLGSPVGITLTPDGVFYVADAFYHRISKYTSTGDFIESFGSFGTGNSQFRYPESVAADGAGHVFVADYQNCRVVKYGCPLAILPPQPADRTVETGTNVAFSVAVQGSPPITYTWRKNGVAIQTGSPTLSIPNAQPGDAGTYDLIACTSCGCVTTRTFQFTVCTTPTIDVPTAARLAGTSEGTNVTLTATVSGSSTLQWFCGQQALTDGTHYSGATTNALTIINPQIPDAGYYHLEATGNCQTVSGPVISLEIAPCYQTPVITQQPPAKQLVALGDAVTMSIAASCCAPFSYQWVFFPLGSNTYCWIPGATGASLTINPVTYGSLGTYFCMVSNRGRYAYSIPSVVATSAEPVFWYVQVIPGCDHTTLVWHTDVPVNATLHYWTEGCDNGVASTTGPSSLGTSDIFNVAIPGPPLFARIEGVAATNESGRTYCIPLIPKLQGPAITAVLSTGASYYFTGLPGGGDAAPVQFLFRNDGCSVSDEGDVQLAAPVIDGVPQAWLKADGSPAFPSTLHLTQIAAGNGSFSNAFYVRVKRPAQGVTERHTLSARVLYTPVGGSPVWLYTEGWLYLTADYPL